MAISAGMGEKGIGFGHGSDFLSREESGRERVILHCDANSFFASVETVLHPEYKDVPMAVCGSVEDRHGIVLAKNEQAKKYKIKTGETVWQAKQKCPSLVIARPTYGVYNEFSRRMNRIFSDYTDLIEPFGIDESWLDVTDSKKLFGDGKSIADAIRKRVREELGITVSVGVSFNKVFAKLGSDMKKPDATTVIEKNSFGSTVWRLPVSELLFVGPACNSRLNRVGIMTIGDLAAADSDFLKRYLGKNGLMLKSFACGNDLSPVMPSGYEPEPKSVSNGMTFRYNLVTGEDVSFAVTYLSHMVAARLRRHGKLCRVVAVTVRFPNQISVNRRVGAARPTNLACDIARDALFLIKEKVGMGEEIYAVTVHAESLTDACGADLQETMFPTEEERDFKKHLSLETAVDSIKERYGNTALTICSAIGNRLI